MHRRGARVTGIDAGGDRDCGRAPGIPKRAAPGVSYERTTAEELAAREPGRFDVVTCLELLEHVPDPASLVCACAALARPGGHLFFSTINRTPKSWLFAVVGRSASRPAAARHPRLRPLSAALELDRAARGAGLDLAETAGLRYDPFTGRGRLGGRPDVNYLAWYRRPAESGEDPPKSSGRGAAPTEPREPMLVRLDSRFADFRPAPNLSKGA